MVKRGQAAMEFLMTYGWAILVVLAAIGALAYFGVLSPDNFLPNRCTTGGEFGCMESQVRDDGSVVLVLQNNVGATLSNVSVALLNPADTATVLCGPWESSGNTANGQQLNGTAGITLTGCHNQGSGERFQADILIEYSRSGSELTHSVGGTLQRRIE